MPLTSQEGWVLTLFISALDQDQPQTTCLEVVSAPDRRLMSQI